MNKIILILTVAFLGLSCNSNKIIDSKLINSPIIVGNDNYLIYEPDNSKNYFTTTITNNITHHFKVIKEINLKIEEIRDLKEQIIEAKSKARKKDKTIYSKEITRANEKLKNLKNKSQQAEEALNLWNQYLDQKINSSEDDPTNLPTEDINRPNGYIIENDESWNVSNFSELIGYRLGIYYYEKHNPSITKAQNLKQVLIREGYPEKKIEFKPRSWKKFQSLNNIYGNGFDVRYCEGEEDAAAYQLSKRLKDFFKENVELGGVADCSLTPNSITIVIKIAN